MAIRSDPHILVGTWPVSKIFSIAYLDKYSIKLWLEAIYDGRRAVVDNITLTLTKF